MEQATIYSSNKISISPGPEQQKTGIQVCGCQLCLSQSCYKTLKNKTMSEACRYHFFFLHFLSEGHDIPNMFQYPRPVFSQLPAHFLYNFKSATITKKKQNITQNQVGSPVFQCCISFITKEQPIQNITLNYLPQPHHTARLPTNEMLICTINTTLCSSLNQRSLRVDNISQQKSTRIV